MPDSWEWVRLGKLITLISGRDLKRTEYVDGKIIGLPYLTGASNFQNGQIVTGRYTEKPSVISTKGELLITVKGTIGEMAFNPFEQAHIARQIMSIQSIYLNLNFLKYLLTLLLPCVKQQAQSMIPGVSRESLLSILIPLPPLAEQKRIVAQIERALEKVEVYAESYNKLQELDKAFPDNLKKSILQYAMQGKLVAQDTNDESVEVLLEKIRAEKQKLYEEGKLKKKDLAEMVVEKGDDNSPYGKNGNFDMEFHRKSNWLLLPLEKLVISVPTKDHQIKHSDIKEIGMFPVVSQSQVLVEGFSDDKTKVLDNQEHLIIFGDHTRTVKLIDFSFIVGADGVKILQPIGISPQFLKYHLECTILFVKDRGYARHYSYLKNKLIGIPSTDEQNKITNKIDLLFEKVAQL
ncbi:TPA: restriction endonuclease subunit S [Streptococcus suis]